WNSLPNRKRQRTAALQNLRNSDRVGHREASWTAAVLCRFFAREPSPVCRWLELVGNVQTIGLESINRFYDCGEAVRSNQAAEHHGYSFATGTRRCFTAF